MGAPSDLCLAILAAGGSTRFGPDDKLAAPFRGGMLGSVVSDMLAGRDFAQKFVIAPDAVHPCAGQWRASGYGVIPNPDAAQGLSTSIRVAAVAAETSGAEGLMICLADMPLVSLDLIDRLIGAFDAGKPRDCLAAIDGAVRSPPAIFGRGLYPALKELNGDTGARDLVADARPVAARSGELADVDTPDELAALARHRD